MSLEFRFLGAARFVTGSKHLMTFGGKRVLLDCGLVQGPRAMADKANRNLPLGPNDVDVVVLSHAHIDHSGALPCLVRAGFRGRIVCTEATADLVSILLRDSASIQQSDAAYLRKHGHPYDPLYEERDVLETLKLLRPVPYHEQVDVIDGVRVTFLDAGHILGAAIVVLDVGDGPSARRVVFTGDHGRKNLPILRDPERIPECDVLITESTYGDRLHETANDMERDLETIVREEARDGGRILIPAFSVGRTQNVVMFLGKLMAAGRIPKMQIFVDSPLSRETTKVMSRHPDLFDADTQAILKRGESPFFFDGVRYVATVDESKELNGVRSGIVIAASGMCEAGRILHHLKVSVGRAEDCVLLVGYQGTGTLGRRLQDGAEEVKLYGMPYRVNCKVRSMGGFSAHGDWRDLIAAERHLAQRASHVFVVHGETDPAHAFADRLRGVGFRNVEIPSHGQKFEVA
jgi:metallo-beta-lactamase family protein